MPIIKDNERCRECNGVGLVRNDNPMSDRVYGEYCPYCNGSGMASSPTARRWFWGGFIVLNVASVVGAYFWLT